MSNSGLSDSREVDLILGASHSDPFSFLGPHASEKDGQKGWVVRLIRPDAKSIRVQLADGESVEAEKVHADGFFEAWILGEGDFPAYTLEIGDFEGETQQLLADPYRFGPTLTEEDCHYIGEGTHTKLHDVLGSQIREFEGVSGTSFALWAPNAHRVSVVGDFNSWDGRVHPMRRRLESGCWEIFVPGIASGVHYKFEVAGADGHLATKSDPLAFFSQNREQTASITFETQYDWKDADWMRQRAETDVYKKAVSTYEVHLGSWRRVPEEGDRDLSYRELAQQLVDHVVDLGFTHIELLPVTEFPFDGSWGYQVTGYFAPTSRYGDPDDFRFFVDACHQRGIGVILDWVPAHFPKDAHGLANFDGTRLYEHADPREGEHMDWGTLIFNFGRNEVRNFLFASALYWFEEFHLDGLRVDAVASLLYRDYSREEGEWVPNRFGGRENLEAIDFLRDLNRLCYEKNPGIMMLAEESTAFAGVSRPVDSGGLGFGFKWNMGWMHDMLEFIEKEPIHRKFHHDKATFSMLYAYDENFVLVLSHDEVVHGKGSMLAKMPGDNWQKFANLRLFYAWMFAHPGKKLLFQGCEIAPFTEWDFKKSLDWHLLDFPEHRGIYRLLRDLNGLYAGEPALHELDHDPAGFEWMESNDSETSVFAFLRKPAVADGRLVLCVVNATPVVRSGYRVGVPRGGFWEEIFNSDAEIYAGSNKGNSGGVQASDEGWAGRPHSLTLDLPPLSALFLRA
ncbi:MAG: 1,4-alpha-glucan branching enzyme [Verrucomicrobiales bacterium]|jgi:1,4-alpha-glucan branching enzyme